MTETMTGRATELTRLSREHAAHNYRPLSVVIDEAEGAWVTDVDGRRYLDLLAAYSAGLCSGLLVRNTTREPRPRIRATVSAAPGKSVPPR